MRQSVAKFQCSVLSLVGRQGIQGNYRLVAKGQSRGFENGQEVDQACLAASQEDAVDVGEKGSLRIRPLVQDVSRSLHHIRPGAQFKLSNLHGDCRHIGRIYLGAHH